MFGPRGRRGAFAVAGAGVGGLDLEGSSAYDLDAVHGDRGLQQLHTAAGTGDFGVYLERADGYRPHELVRHASKPETLRGGQLLEGANEQGRRRAAVERVRVPRPTGELRSDKTAIRAFEHWRCGHRGER